jgi:ABC-type branched-subunit amino acid transport system ATPase component
VKTRAKMLEIKSLMVFFENSLAINDLSLEVHKKEVVGVLGSNNADEYDFGFDD